MDTAVPWCFCHGNKPAWRPDVIILLLFPGSRHKAHARKGMAGERPDCRTAKPALAMDSQAGQ